MSMPKSKSKSVEVREYMERKPVTVTAEMNIYDASQKILEHKISGVAVVDADNNLVGILSELDCMRALVTSVYNGSDPGGALVKDVMTANVEVNKPDDDIISVASSMLDHKHRRRPVVVDGKLVGQLTCRQILSAIKDFS
ncbi:MAG: CBS domain-containing protein [Candidatus Paceibacteria bacterium]|jgi:CBS domain-containing protein